MSTQPIPATPDQIPGPVTLAERFGTIDTLRGVAVLGILIMNIYGFAMPFAAYSNPLVMGGMEWYNIGTWFATHVIADQKFMTIFSMLFGAGIVLMWERARARDAKFGRIYYRRMFWLLVIGLIHGYLIWFGDILFHYALMGMLIYPMRKLQARTLIIVACLLLPVALLLNHGGYIYLSDLQSRTANITALQQAGETISEEQQASLDEWAEIGAFLEPSDETLQEDLDAYLGTYGDAVKHRAPILQAMQINMTIWFAVWRIGALMLIGMALMKLGVFSGSRTPGFYTRLMLIGYGIGLPLSIYSAMDLHAHDFSGLYMMQRGGIANYIGSILVALGHIGLVIGIVKKGALRNLSARFAAVGRMAFSNYLMHSIVMTTIFYGHGLGLYGSVPRAAQMLFVAGMLGLQLLLSPWWLARYRFGPAEWLWRSLTYWQRQPMKA
ncbi:DUF418 domain-containing protein [Woeseia oceani]|uniref:DUF418 domain-containing protein n=1 Tax=Woeseia oceani TaxID=1548547 RepID=A0A193LJ33_9GAMM|nr:DUF418 domain-containing protein [Woeseia oceani]ANO52458.1 hypothetical protein BA177_15840 [Woeseia oceani]